jgi:hypothetical protein
MADAQLSEVIGDSRGFGKTKFAVKLDAVGGVEIGGHGDIVSVTAATLFSQRDPMMTGPLQWKGASDVPGMKFVRIAYRQFQQLRVNGYSGFKRCHLPKAFVGNLAPNETSFKRLRQTLCGVTALHKF